MTLLIPAHSKVYPSGGELITACVAILVAAPGLFSMIICWPRRCDNQAPIILATMSAPPPGENPMIQWIGGVGEPSAQACGKKVASRAERPSFWVKRRRGIRMVDAPGGPTDENTSKNFTRHARRGHHHCRDKVTSAQPVGSSATNDTPLSC